MSKVRGVAVAASVNSRDTRAIEEKCSQLDESGAMRLARERDDVHLLIGINTDRLPFPEPDLMDALLGPLAVQITTDDKGEVISTEYIRDHSSSIFRELQDGNLISAVICYETSYVSDGRGKTVIIPKGVIFDNPCAKNRLSPSQLEELVKCIFTKS